MRRSSGRRTLQTQRHNLLLPIRKHSGRLKPGGAVRGPMSESHREARLNFLDLGLIGIAFEDIMKT